jgi:hypothetical protein
MEEQSSTTAFDEWLRQVFDHPVADPAWRWGVATDTPEPAPRDCVAYLTRLFEEPEPALAPYSDAQINQGLWYLVDPSCSNYAFSLVEPEVPWPQRRRGLRAMATLFERLFARRCSDHLLHLEEVGAGPLNPVCYMWWDVFPAFGRPTEPDYAAVDVELLAVMKRALALDSLACQESALHGLGHWQQHYPGVVEQTINEFLARADGMRPELREYAECARLGYVE